MMIIPDEKVVRLMKLLKKPLTMKIISRLARGDMYLTQLAEELGTTIQNLNAYLLEFQFLHVVIPRYERGVRSIRKYLTLNMDNFIITLNGGEER